MRKEERREGKRRVELRGDGNERKENKEWDDSKKKRNKSRMRVTLHWGSNECTNI